MELNLVGKRVVVTASTEGIGKGIARALAKEGCKLVVSSRTEEKVRRTVEELRKVNPSVWGTKFDVTNYEDSERLFSFAMDVMGGVDAVVVNTGNPPSEPSYFEETSMEDWDYSVKLYLTGVVKLVKTFLPEMVKNGWGRMIFLSSWTVKEPQRIFSLADVSRAPLTQLAKILAKTYAKYNITFNVILMGSFETEGAKRTIKRLAEKEGKSFEELWKEVVLSTIPSGRIGSPERDLAPLVAFLLSDKSWYVNGTSILIDGGLTDAV
ncbi:MAG: SDR family oxidoreductase [Candidatus Aramenus sp.]|nr:SDR family oxidoreductase [Candidatus Aramenus sp.]